MAADGRLPTVKRGPRLTRVPLDVLRAQLEVLAEHETRLRAEHAAIEGRQAVWRQAQRRWDDLTLWCQDMAANLATLDYRGRRLALEALVLRVKAFPPDRDPRWEITADFPLDVPQIVIPDS
jgi:hypothetical protein